MSELFLFMPDAVLDKLKEDIFHGTPDKKSTLQMPKGNAVVDLLNDTAVSCNNHFLTNAVVKNDPRTPI